MSNSDPCRPLVEQVDPHDRRTLAEMQADVLLGFDRVARDHRWAPWRPSRLPVPADLGFDQRQVLSPAVVAALTAETRSATPSAETDSATPSTPPAVDVVPVADVRRSIAEVVAWQLMSVRTYDEALRLRNMANDLWHDLNLGGERLGFIAECGFPENPRDMYDAIAARTAPSTLELS